MPVGHAWDAKPAWDREALQKARCFFDINSTLKIAKMHVDTMYLSG